MVYERILINPQQIQEIVAKLAKDISAFYSGEHITALVLLEGAKYFAEDLLAKIDLPFERENIQISSYCGTASCGTVTIDIDDDLREKLSGKNILIIDDIYDTGKTLSALLRCLESCRPQSIKTCVLLEKEIAHDKKIGIDFPGLKVPDVFVIGYGLDFNGKHRELPFIAELASEHIEG